MKETSRKCIVIVRLDQVQFVNLFAYFNFDVLKLQDLQIVLSLGKYDSTLVESTLLVLIYDHSVWAKSIVVRDYIIRN